jgi:hypothetical protein
MPGHLGHVDPRGLSTARRERSFLGCRMFLTDKDPASKHHVSDPASEHHVSEHIYDILNF